MFVSAERWRWREAPSSVVADTSGLLAALDSAHPEHQAAQEAITAAGLLVMSPLLLAELDHAATRQLGREAAVSAIDGIRGWTRRGRASVPEITEAHLGRAQTVRPRYPALDLDLTDVVNVALAADYDTDAILTLDRRDFRAVRPLGHHKAFRVLTDDLPV
ncbi:twitching motility protein PilT [Streptomyces sp. PRh5]|uniref:PIN domain-containing protein n=1 Tax=Streptomyces sp. PRh5 TaxID=1158056 RepID=UPI00045302AD|nr:PIN domain-containing protein [Streptomyces sp. PRh5]EXU66520.1 twitching motility protein PilT [Streptomyces sp. PRh5]